ncbi:hypothetical protein E2C01_018719 [Portunus trituberculatus]|uniref:Uncharacterized protein n=1 Tax=Portunus trituberculatus TaxID=210409 RepID=A0A5B7DWY4_PORTR|nr:hypothetical protein [Portunus trituberculatus]
MATWRTLSGPPSVDGGILGEVREVGRLGGGQVQVGQHRVTLVVVLACVKCWMCFGDRGVTEYIGLGLC